MSYSFFSPMEYTSSFQSMSGLFISAKLLEKKDDKYIETNFHTSALDDVSTGLGYKNSKTGKQMKVQLTFIRSKLDKDVLENESSFMNFIDECDDLLSKSMRKVNRDRLPYAKDDDSKRYQTQSVGFAQWKKLVNDNDWKVLSLDLTQLKPTDK